MSDQPALVRLAAGVVARATTPVSLGVEIATYSLDRGEELWAHGMALADETTRTVAALRRVLTHVADALDAGIVDDIRTGVVTAGEAVELLHDLSAQIERAMPVVEATAPSLTLLNATLAQLNSTVAQLEGLPGVRLARRFVNRPGGSAPSEADG